MQEICDVGANVPQGCDSLFWARLDPQAGYND